MTGIQSRHQRDFLNLRSSPHVVDHGIAEIQVRIGKAVNLTLLAEEPAQRLYLRSGQKGWQTMRKGAAPANSGLTTHADGQLGPSSQVTIQQLFGNRRVAVVGEAPIAKMAAKDMPRTAVKGPAHGRLEPSQIAITAKRLFC